MTLSIIIPSFNNNNDKFKNIVYNFAFDNDAFQKAFDELKKLEEYSKDTTFVKFEPPPKLNPS